MASYLSSIYNFGVLVASQQSLEDLTMFLADSLLADAEAYTFSSLLILLISNHKSLLVSEAVKTRLVALVNENCKNNSVYIEVKLISTILYHLPNECSALVKQIAKDTYNATHKAQAIAMMSTEEFKNIVDEVAPGIMEALVPQIMVKQKYNYFEVDELLSGSKRATGSNKYLPACAMALHCPEKFSAMNLQQLIELLPCDNGRGQSARASKSYNKVFFVKSNNTRIDPEYWINMMKQT